MASDIWYNFKFNGSDIKHANNKIFVYMYYVVVGVDMTHKIKIIKHVESFIWFQFNFITNIKHVNERKEFYYIHAIDKNFPRLHSRWSKYD